VDEGTTFNVFLPAARHGSTADQAEGVARKVRGGTETILLVEDETAVRGLATVVLQKHGYRVLEAPSGHAALEIWKQHASEVDLLLTDLVMPGGMTGMDLAEKLKASNPKLKVIYSSGYSTELTGQILESKEGKLFLQKPYHPQDLAETVRKLLDQPG
jgi:CheY-like chemotaxis protein